jgi:hypothetical protein
LQRILESKLTNLETHHGQEKAGISSIYSTIGEMAIAAATFGHA